MSKRHDGRKADALRTVSIVRDFTKHAQGSVLVSFGDTKVICTACFEEGVPPFLRNSGKGWVTAEYAMLPGSTNTRIRRDNNKKGRAQEISRLIGRSLRAVVDMEAMGECQLSIDCDVIQADGGTRTASITGAYVAMHDAFSWAVGEGMMDAIPLKHACAAISVGMVNGFAALDLDYVEDSGADVDMNVVMDDEGRFIELQGCAEGESFSRGEMNDLLDLAVKGNQELIKMQQKALGS